MTHIVCLIANPELAPLEAPLVQELARTLGGEPHWLAEAEACELAVVASERSELLARARGVVGDARIDLCVMPAARSPKRLLISDMDSTIITTECIDELADLAGVGAKVAAITRRAMNGEIDFTKSLVARARWLEGLPATAYDEVYRERVHLMPGAATLVRTMRARGAYTALVSGGFAPIAERVQRAVGFDLAVANRLEVVDGRLTGRVLEPIQGPETKLETLLQLSDSRGLDTEDAVAVGDGANDLPLLGAAGLGVAFRAHGHVAKAAQITIVHGNLTALLYLQGIARADFVTTRASTDQRT